VKSAAKNAGVETLKTFANLMSNEDKWDAFLDDSGLKQKDRKALMSRLEQIRTGQR